MKQFGKILKFELKNYFTNKVFVGITIFLMLAIIVVMCLPRIIGLFESDDSFEEIPTEKPVMLVGGSADIFNLALQMFSEAFVDYDVQKTASNPEEIKNQIITGEADCAFYLDDSITYKYYVNNLSMYDSNTLIADELLRTAYRMFQMMENGISPEEAGNIMNVVISSETVNLGVDQMENFFYTYIMIFALYMVILLYGQMVATNVATEKSSRAMEILITSARPTSMMFGKVIASCLAGLMQLIAIFGTSLVFYRLNKSYWAGNMIIDSIFNMPVDLFFYMLLFFVLGFLVYAFLFGAIGSTASKLEDINTSVMPITLLFVVGFLVVVMSMSTGEIDNTIMKICSYVPFTSSMAMFTRIAMSVVPVYEIVTSIAILIVTVVGTGYLAAKIYRVGVLLYGTPPKLSAIIKAIKKS